MVPRLASAETLGLWPRPWRGVVTDLSTILLAPLVDYATQRRWQWNREGGGEEKDRDRRRQNNRQDGWAKRSRGARSDNENTLPLGGRVEGKVWLYGERGRGGRADREKNNAIIKREIERRRYYRHALARVMPVDESRDLIPMRGAPSPSPLHQHPIQVPPAAQVAWGYLGIKLRNHLKITLS